MVGTIAILFLRMKHRGTQGWALCPQLRSWWVGRQGLEHWPSSSACPHHVMQADAQGPLH